MNWKLAGRGVEPAPEEQRFGKHQPRHDERDGANRLLAVLLVPHEQQEERTGDRQRDERAQNWKRHQGQR